MPIQIVCPGCHKRFKVSEKFAGKEGPCPQCKTIISIPKPEDEVVIHAPDHSEAGAVDAKGRSVLKTYRRKDASFQPLVFTAVIGAVLATLLVAFVLRGSPMAESWLLLATGSALLGPPLAWAGYTFLRDPELGAYSGLELIIRVVACGLVYALLWGVYCYLGENIFSDKDFATPLALEIFELVALSGGTLALATLAAYVAFDLEPLVAFFHGALYFAVTVLLRLLLGLAALPGLVTGG